MPARFLLACCLCVYAVGGGADEPDVPKFDDVHKQWKQNDAAIDDVIAKFRQAKPEERRDLVKKYEELVKQAKALLPTLRKSALVAYREAPNAKAEVTQILLGVAASQSRNDEYEDAAEIVQLLLDKKCTEKGLPAVAGGVFYSRDEFDKAAKQLREAQESGTMDRQTRVYLEDVEKAEKLWRDEQKVREAEAKADDLPRVKMETSKGTLVIELFENEAPGAVGNFVSLVEKKFYDGLTFHRVLAGFMAQGGCPQGTGTGGPGYHIYCECEKPNYRPHFRGSLSMAHAGKDTGGSQFFLTFHRTPHLDGRHTVFGRVIEGFDVLAKLQRIDPQNPGGDEPDKIVKATVVRKRDHAYEPVKVK